MHRIKLLALLLAFAALPSTASAQISATAELRGQIIDQNGAIVRGATVSATDEEKGTTRSVVTNSAGEYVLLTLLPSRYTIRVDAANFSPKTLTDVRLQVGQQLNLDIEIKTGEVGAVVDVYQNEAPLIESERTQQSTIISSRLIENLPINRRNFLDFALLTPGVTDSDNINDSTDARVVQTQTSGLSFGGNNGRGNSVTVDGASADTSTGSIREVISQEGVREFQVIRNSYNAEFGGASGGLVNIVTKSGTNDLKGSAFGYFRGRRFDARNAFDNLNPSGEKSPLSRQQFGGSLGGAIIPSRTFFFFAGEGLNEKRTSFVRLNDSLTRGFEINSAQNNFLNYLAARPAFAQQAAVFRSVLSTPNARTTNLFTNDSGNLPLKMTNSNLSLRLDHTVDNSDSVYARIVYGDFYQDNQASGSLIGKSRSRTLETRSFGVVLGETHLFNPVTVNELKLQFNYYDIFVTPNDPNGPEINIDGFGSFRRDIFLPSRLIERRFDMTDTVSTVRDTHTIKFGGSLTFNRVPAVNETYTGGRFNFGALPFLTLFGTNTAPIVTTIATDPTLTNEQRFALLNTSINGLQAYNVNLPQVYQQAFGDTTKFSQRTNRFAVFAQDTWKMLPNVTVNYGLRYSIQDETDPIPTDKNNFQPRFGIAWDVFSNNKTILRAGGGIYTGPIDGQITNVVNTLSSGTAPYNLNLIAPTITDTPSAPLIYQTLLAQNVIGTRQITRADIAQFGLSTAPGRPFEARIRLGENFENPQTYQASAAFQQDFGGGFALEVSYLFQRGLHIVRPVDVRQYTTAAPCSFSNIINTTRRLDGCFSTAPILEAVNPRLALDLEYQSVANSYYNAGTLQLTRRFANYFSINTNYTFSKAIDDVVDFNSDFLAQDPTNVRNDRSVSAFDQRHRFITSAVFESPYRNVFLRDFVFAPVFTLASGRPFTMLLGFDNNGDRRPTNDRPDSVGRNTGLGDNYYSLDFRLARRFSIRERQYLEFTFEGFNTLNTVNYSSVNNVVGTACVNNLVTNPNCRGAAYVIPANPRAIKGISPTQPLAYTSAFPARQFQFGARYNF